MEENIHRYLAGEAALVVAVEVEQQRMEGVEVQQHSEVVGWKSHYFCYWSPWWVVFLYRCA